MIPFIFSSLAIAAVGRAAMDMVMEVRRQFKEIPGIMEGKATPEYEKCVEISTNASIREMSAQQRPSTSKCSLMSPQQLFSRASYSARVSSHGRAAHGAVATAMA